MIPAIVKWHRVCTFGEAWKPGKRPCQTTVDRLKICGRILDQYVTVSQLARYWRISRAQIHKKIESGTLRAIRLGPRLLRISTADAIHFERMVKTTQNAEE